MTDSRAGVFEGWRLVRLRTRRWLARKDALAVALALTAALLQSAAGAQPPTVVPRAGIRAATPEEVAKRIREEEDAIKAEPPVAGLSRPVSYYLRTRLPNLAPLSRDDATEELFGFAATELHQPSPFACIGDFDGDGLEDVALVAKDRATQRLRLIALHQVTVNWNVGGLRSKSYQAFTLVEGGPVAPGTKFEDLLVVCEKPGRFESVDGGVTLSLRHQSIRYGFSLYYYISGRYQELLIGD
jgi:hypothetical protein